MGPPPSRCAGEKNWRPMLWGGPPAGEEWDGLGHGQGPAVDARAASHMPSRDPDTWLHCIAADSSIQQPLAHVWRRRGRAWAARLGRGAGSAAAPPRLRTAGRREGSCHASDAHGNCLHRCSRSAALRRPQDHIMSSAPGGMGSRSSWLACRRLRLRCSSTASTKACTAGTADAQHMHSIHSMVGCSPCSRTASTRAGHRSVCLRRCT